MTANQINYAKLAEEQRANLRKEEQNERALAETERSNKAREYETSRANTLNYNASIYSAQVSQRNAELAYEANMAATSQREAAANLQHEEKAWTINQGYQQMSQDYELGNREVNANVLNSGLGFVNKLVDSAIGIAKFVIK